jgi:hypothetical protein
MSSFPTLKEYLDAEKVTQQSIVDNTGGEYTAAEKTVATAKLVTINKQLDELTNYAGLRTNANNALTSAYSTLSSAASDLNNFTKEANYLSDQLDTDVATTKKVIEINTYYSKQYEAYKELFILVTIVSVCIVISLMLSYTPLEFLSRSLTIAICIIGGTLVIYKIIYMMLTTDTNYDEYNWLVAPATDNGLPSDSIIDISGLGVGGICVGPLCCGEGTEWNSKKGCVLLSPARI